MGSRRDGRCRGRGTGGVCDWVPPRRPQPVNKYRQRGGEQRSSGRDQDDLPVMHAGGDGGVGPDPGWDLVHRPGDAPKRPQRMLVPARWEPPAGREWRVGPPGGGRRGYGENGAGPRRQAGRATARAPDAVHGDLLGTVVRDPGLWEDQLRSAWSHREVAVSQLADTYAVGFLTLG